MSRPHLSRFAKEYMKQTFQLESKRKGFGKVLDAVATLLVRQPENEVISVGLQRCKSNRGIVLAIASSQRVPFSTVEHACSLWDHMRCLGRLVDETFLRLNARALSDADWLDRQTQVRLMLRSFKAQIYEFCLPGVFACLRTQDGRGQATVAAFSDFVFRHPGTGSLNLFALNLGRLSDLLPALLLAEPLQSGSLGTTYFVDIMDSLLSDTSWMHANPGVHSSSSSRYFISPSFDMFLENLAAVDRAVRTLTGSIGHRRVYRRYIRDKGLRIEVVPRGICAPPRHMEGTAVHPECAMAIHLLRGNQSGMPSTAYMGQSRRKCSNCYLFLRALMRVSGSEFRMRKRLRPKACLDWQFPNEELAHSGLSFGERMRIFHLFRFAVRSAEE